MGKKLDVDEMVRSKTPEEWREILEEECRILGIKFVPKGEGVPYEPLFPPWEEDGSFEAMMRDYFEEEDDEF